MKIFEFLAGLFRPKNTVLIIPQPAADPTSVVPEPAVPVLANTPVVTSVVLKPSAFRKFRITYYYVSDQAKFIGGAVVPVYTKDGEEICRVEPGFFGEMSLQGTGKMRDGRLLNVSSTFVPVRHEDYAGVWERHKRYLIKRPPGYSGIVVKNDRVVAAMTYHVVDDVGVGYGKIRGKAHTPFKTLAADIGRLARHEPKWMGKGGVCPPHTKVFIKQMVGRKCPVGDGSWFVHDGWFDVIDTGGGIFGKHFDMFVGTPALVKNVTVPATADVWYDRIEERVPPDDKYTYGLYDK